MDEPTVCRHHKGGNAHFRAGAELVAFDVDTDIRVTKNVFMTVTANTVKVVWRSIPGKDPMPSMVRKLLQSMSSPLSATPCFPTDEFWLEFHHPEYAHIALKTLRPLNSFEAILVYDVHFTAPILVADTVFTQLVQLAERIPGVNHVWRKPAYDFAVLHLTGVHREEMVYVKDIAHALFKGRTVTIDRYPPDPSRYEVWHPFFAEPEVDEWLRRVGHELGAIVSVDQEQERLILHEDDGYQRKVFRQILTKKIATLEAAQEAHTIKLSNSTWQAVFASKILTQAQKVLGPDHVRLDNLTKALFIKCPPQTEHFLRRELGRSKPCIDRVEAKFMCPYCCKADQAIMLSSCEHIICVDCYNRQAHVANSDIESEHFPLVCRQSVCGQPISLSDLRKLIPVGRVQGSLHSIFEASAQAHVCSHPEKYRKCRLTDCDTIYLLTETPRLFTCSICLTQTCTYRNCGASPHIGLTCEQYKVRLLNSLPTQSHPLT
ncbi:hypothetical protein EJ07DRAFT_129321 [Lizonia empirigonia]|nr:hypothetical protein EJ07DRAFT_129321 [Lizonia empirigonia]